MVNVTDNAINEKCSRIKEAFLKVADDFIARNYYIVLDRHEYRGEGNKKNSIYVELLKKIMLSRDLIIYPKEISDIEVLVPEERKKVIKEELEEMREQYCALNGLFFDKSYPKGALIENIQRLSISIQNIMPLIVTVPFFIHISVNTVRRLLIISC